MAKITVPEAILTQLRRAIAEHGEAILGAAEGEETYVVQPTGGFIEPEDEDELHVVLDAVQETDKPWLTSQQARDQPGRSHEHGWRRSCTARRPWLQSSGTATTAKRADTIGLARNSWMRSRGVSCRRNPGMRSSRRPSEFAASRCQ